MIRGAISFRCEIMVLFMGRVAPKLHGINEQTATGGTGGLKAPGGTLRGKVDRIRDQ
jgi:hypothetical protein